MYLRYLCEFAFVCVFEDGDGAHWGWVVECVLDVKEAGQDEVVCGWDWHCHVGREPTNRVADAFCIGFPNPHGVASVGVWGWSEVPTIDGVRCPGITCG
mmetsp:Transcript_35823/g.50764  ORF Transcript_35823/g.50764 Transcript_35823/m.50764 type:complete len:99 (+) Transcript_35823:117-413(+)